MMARRQTQAAFSIVELLVSLALLVFGAFAVYEQFLLTHRQGRRQLDRIQARYLAHQQLEQLRVADYADLKAWQPLPVASPCSDFPRFLYQDQVAPRSDGLLELTVKVGWDMTLGQKFDPAHSVTVKGLKAP